MVLFLLQAECPYPWPQHIHVHWEVGWIAQSETDIHNPAKDPWWVTVLRTTTLPTLPTPDSSRLFPKP